MLNKFRIFIIFSMFICVITIISGCSEQSPVEVAENDKEQPQERTHETSEPTNTVEQGEKLRIGVSINAIANIHNRHMFEYAEQAIKEAGHEAVMVNANGHAVQQVTDIENLIQQGVDVIVIQNGDTDALFNVVQEASSQGIPVISQESGWIPGSSAMFAMNDFEVASSLYMMLAAEMGYEGEIITINHNDHPAIRARRNVQEAFLKEYTNIQNVNTVTSGFPGTVEIAYRGVENALAANPDVKAIWATFDLEAIGAAQAVMAAGRDDILIVGVDGEQEALELIKNGGPIIATVVGDLKSTAQNVLEVAEGLAYGEEVNRFWGIPYEIVTKENVDKFLEE
ncbi:sugar ABC transporter substrate-binding protein [Alkalihalobacillus oceani]|uniref:sugar ABC transporter substrate-binding protein n=1 Tax=Halalkalibacter oceani TaxID=1653776 RepID=UPI00203ECE4E|nr:sugar ABC transporter substrate-binding protein [Halalkalibacter oceani]MCM3760601.1 sugar ABC transporter substrate-binding protein [Halalkalibacter oceani]